MRIGLLFVLPAAAAAFRAVHSPRAQRPSLRSRACVMAVEGEDTIFRRAEFWAGDTCTLLEIANVMGRWEDASEWAERKEFAIVDARRKEDMAQAASLERYEMAQRMGVVERVALQQNVGGLPFRNEALAAAFGRTTEDFEAMPVSKVAIDVVFDALVESKSGLLKPELCNSRRARWFTPEGGLDPGAIAAGLYKSRSLVLFSWLFFGKGRIYGFAVAAKLAIDGLDVKDKLGGLGPYVDYFLLLGAIVAAVFGVRSQADVAAATADYETVSAAEAEAARQDASGEGQYSTVFEKMKAKQRSEAASGNDTEEQQVDIASEPWVVPLLIVLVGIVSLNVGAKV